MPNTRASTSTAPPQTACFLPPPLGPADPFAVKYTNVTSVQVSPRSGAEFLMRVAGFMRRRGVMRLSLCESFAKVRDLRALEHFPFITSLMVNVDELRSLDGWEHVPGSLESLFLMEIGVRPVSLTILERLTRLESLSVWGRHRDHGAIGSLRGLRRLDLRYVPVEDLGPIAGLKKLRTLGLGHAPIRTLESMRPLAPRLHELELYYLKKLEDVTALEACTALRSLRVEALPCVRAFPSFAGLRRLSEARLHHLKRLESVEGVSLAPALKVLRIGPAPALPVSAYACLRPLKLKEFAAVGGNRKLEAEFARVMGRA